MITLKQGHPAQVKGDVLCYPNTSFGFLVTSALGRELIQTGGPRVEQSIINQRPLRLGSAVLGDAGKLHYSYIVHYINYPGWDKWWREDSTRLAMRSMLAMLERIGSKNPVLMLPVQPPFDASLWPKIVEVTADVLFHDQGDRNWTVLIPSPYVGALWPQEPEKELMVEKVEEVPKQIKEVKEIENKKVYKQNKNKAK